MWKLINEEDWQTEVQTRNLSLFYRVSYLEVISKTYNLKITYMGYQVKGHYYSLVAFFLKGKNLTVPEGFSYSPFYIEKNISEQLYFDLSNSLVKYLKSNFKKIYFKVEVDFFDVRPFIWNNFKIEVKYTRIKLNAEESHYSINRNISKIENINNYEFRVEELSSESLKLNMDFLRKLGSSPYHLLHYSQLVQGWSKEGYLKAFCLYKDGILITSNLVLMDYKNHKVYKILLNNVKSKEKYAHTLLYQLQINWCLENGFNEIDFCGANIPGISVFKSYFNTELKMYFKITYHPVKGFLKDRWDIAFKQLYIIKGYVLNRLKWK